MYGLHERQFRNVFKEAERVKGITGTTLLFMLEKRLDNAVFRAGFASSRNEARQLVVHGHILVNSKRVDLPSYQIKQGDVLTIKAGSQQNARINLSLDGVERRGVPSWLELDRPGYKANVTGEPTREELTMPMLEQLDVALYSK